MLDAFSDGVDQSFSSGPAIMNGENTTEREDQGRLLPNTERLQNASSVLLCVLGTMVAAVGLDRLTGNNLLPPALFSQLRSAKACAIGAYRESGAETQPIRMPGGTMTRVPIGGHYDAASAVRLLLSLRGFRKSYEKSLARIRTAKETGRPAQDHMRSVHSLHDEATKRVAQFFKIERGRAWMVLVALGWGPPPPRSSTESALPPPFPDTPSPIRTLPWPRIEAIRERASRLDEPWIETKAALRKEFGLDDPQILAVQCWLCRSAMRSAFRSPSARERAKTALARHASLTPAQQRAVIGMLGVQMIVDSGAAAFGPLIELTRKRTDIAIPLLRTICGEIGLNRQAFMAVSRLSGNGSREAADEIRALGPFGRAVLRDQVRRLPGEPESIEKELLRELRLSWPQGENPLEVLGSDPRLWERWHKQAKEVL